MTLANTLSRIGDIASCAGEIGAGQSWIGKKTDCLGVTPWFPALTELYNIDGGEYENGRSGPYITQKWFESETMLLGLLIDHIVGVDVVGEEIGPNKVRWTRLPRPLGGMLKENTQASSDDFQRTVNKAASKALRCQCDRIWSKMFEFDDSTGEDHLIHEDLGVPEGHYCDVSSSVLTMGQ